MHVGLLTTKEGSSISTTRSGMSQTRNGVRCIKGGKGNECHLQELHVQGRQGAPSRDFASFCFLALVAKTIIGRSVTLSRSLSDSWPGQMQ